MVIHSHRRAVREQVAPKQPKPQPVLEKEPQPIIIEEPIIIEQPIEVIQPKPKASSSKRVKKILEEIEQEVKEQE